ncbi:MAG: hypothetical protein ACTSR1_00210 [Candidatus Heimdallarchaeota archaeon]
MFTYDYTRKDSNGSYDIIDLSQLKTEIKKSLLNLRRLEYHHDDLFVTFDVILDSEQKESLDTIVNNHVSNPTEDI